MDSPKISIIIPVFNVSSYLQKCITSVISQTLNDIEIILVNDCSPDPLDDKICLDFAKSDKRIKYISHEENKGLGGARNTGLSQANGTYVWFIDSDDFIDINACEFLYTLADSEHVDIIAFGATSHIDGNLDLSDYNHYLYNRDLSILNICFNGNDFLDIAMQKQSFHVSACLHLFNRDYISQYKFRENVFHEDTDLIPIIIHNATSVFCTKYSPYYRLLRKDSITQMKMSQNRLIDKFLCIESLLDYLNRSNTVDNYTLINFMVNEFHNTCNIYLNFDNKSKQLEYLYASLNDKYTEFFNGSIPPAISYDQTNINKQYLDIKHELIRIKESRFWKITSFLRALIS